MRATGVAPMQGRIHRQSLATLTRSSIAWRHLRDWKQTCACRNAAVASLALLPAAFTFSHSSLQRPASSVACEPVQDSSLVIVVGVSYEPGIGFAVAKRFAAEGMKVGMIGRQASRLTAASASIKDSIPGACVDTSVADATNPEEIKVAIAGFEKKHGPCKVLIYNVSARPFPPQEVADCPPERFVEHFNSNVMGALHCVQAVVPQMRETKAGTIIFTGASASWRGTAKFGFFGAAKMGLRSMAQSLAKELNPLGIHVAHVVIDGMVDMPVIHQFVGKPPGRMIDTDAIADVYWMLHCQKPHCFTFEIDVRPNAASWAI